MDRQFFRSAAQIGQGVHRVHHRLGIRHTDHSGKTSRRRRGGTGNDILFIGQAGVSEMNMDIHQSRGYNLTCGVNHLLIALRPGKLAQGLDPAVLQKKIQRLVGPGGRVYHTSVFNQDHSAAPFRYS